MIVTTPSAGDGHRKRPRSSRFAEQAHALPVVPEHLDQSAAPATEYEQMPAMGITPQLCKDFLIVRGSVSAAAIYPAWAMMFSPGLGEIRPSTSHHIIELEVP